MSAAEDMTEHIPAAPCPVCFEDHDAEAHTSIGHALELARKEAIRGRRNASLRWIDVARKLELERSKT